MKTNLKPKAPIERTHEGGQSVRDTPIKQLRRTLMANMLWEDTFYEDGQSVADRMRALVPKCSFEDVATAAIDAREKFKLRHAPLLVVREACRSFNGRKVGDLVARVIQRPDELAELVSIYWQDGRKMLPRQMKIGLARAFKKFSAHQLAKYNQDGAVTLRDVLFLAHVRPRGVEDRYTAKERKGKKEFTLNQDEVLFKQIVEGKLQTPDTWETQLSDGADKRETFMRLIHENKLGGLALLRNLRGMIEAKVPEDVIRDGLHKMNTERILPFRFITAAKYAPRLEDALEVAMLKCLDEQTKFAGKTALLVDVSSSMRDAISSKSELSRWDAACAVAMLLRETCERARVFWFNQSAGEVPPRRGFALRSAIPQASGSTSLRTGVDFVYKAFPECERLIVLTDEQSSDRPQQPRGRGYIVNVAANKNGIAYGPWLSVDGWSEAVIDFIREFEQED